MNNNAINFMVGGINDEIRLEYVGINEELNKRWESGEEK